MMSLRSPLFEAVNLLHGMAQLAVSSKLLSDSGYTVHLVAAQRILIMANTALLAYDYNCLCEDNEKNKPLLNRVTIGSALIALMASIYINKFYKPSIDLTEILKGAVNLSPEELSTIQLSWGAPWIHLWGSFISLSRIAINSLSLFAESQRSVPVRLMIAASQALVVHKDSQALWISFEKVFTSPEAPIWSSTGPQDFIKQVKITSYFLVHPLTSLPDALKAIYNYCTNFFNNSTDWIRYWEIKDKALSLKKTHFDSKLVYTVLARPPEFQGNRLHLYMDEITAWALDKMHGGSYINLLYPS
jgi:hypothetical protein